MPLRSFIHELFGAAYDARRHVIPSPWRANCGDARPDRSGDAPKPTFYANQPFVIEFDDEGNPDWQVNAGIGDPNQNGRQRELTAADIAALRAAGLELSKAQTIKAQWAQGKSNAQIVAAFGDAYGFGERTIKTFTAIFNGSAKGQGGAQD